MAVGEQGKAPNGGKCVCLGTGVQSTTTSGRPTPMEPACPGMSTSGMTRMPRSPAAATT